MSSKTYLSAVFTLRRRGLRLKEISSEAISKLDGLIELIQHAISAKRERSSKAPRNRRRCSQGVQRKCRIINTLQKV